MESSPDFCNIEPIDQSRDYRQEHHIDRSTLRKELRIYII